VGVRGLEPRASPVGVRGLEPPTSAIGPDEP
jgi:hypothetical protein